MPRADLDAEFEKIDELVREINDRVPIGTSYENTQFRADLAGLLVVATAATYETCVKNILFDYAESHHASFGGYARRSYEKINSRVSISDLHRYCDIFDPAIKIRFKSALSKKKKAILERTGKDIEVSYKQILDWRHEFAHAGSRSTTIEEATRTHRLGKRILYLFDSAFFFSQG